ncbi:MAG: hypothetical protein D3903_05390 [Candidatus Electrothrix sp. GM3_4]|nr:hypothetical protein [Candidatus Electrothrix sp. GM3_4]
MALFLSKLGWKKIASNRSSIMIYLEPNEEEPFEIYLPTKKIQEYDKKINDALNVLSIVLEKPYQLIINKINGIDNDLHNYRINKENNAIKVALIQSLLNANKTMLVKASKLAYNKHIYENLSSTEKKSRKGPRDASNDYFMSCNFLHTWKGSFGMTIETPIKTEQNSHQLTLFDNIIEKTFERETTNLILKGFELINGAVERKTYNYILDEVETPDDFLFFSSFPDLLGNIESNIIEYSVDVSPLIPVTSEVKTNIKTKLSEKSINYIYDAVEDLKTPSKELDVTIIGFPEKIYASKQSIISNNNNNENLKVTVKGISREIETTSLTMFLTIDDYQKAINAHREARDVRVTCKVRKKTRGWDVLSVESFDLINI